MSDNEDEGLRRIIREFRESTSAEFSEHRDRLDRVEGRLGGVEGRLGGVEERVTGLAGEMRTRMLTMETAILNSISELGGHVQRLEGRMDEHLRRHHGDAA